MKSLLLLSLMIASLGIAAQAQGIRYGVKAGLNMSTVKGHDYDDDDQRSFPGLALGVLARIPITTLLSFQPELLFSQEGTQWKDGDYHERERLNYILLPLALQYMHEQGFFGSTGPQLAYLLAAKEKYKDGSFSETYDLLDDYKRFAFAWFLTLGYQHQSGFGGALRYNLGLSNIVEDNSDKAHNRGFNISLFYLLPTRK